MEENNKNNFELEGFDSVSRGYRVTPEGGFYEDRAELPQEDKPAEPPEEAEVPEVQINKTTTEENEPTVPSPEGNQESKKRYGIGIMVVAVLLSALIGAASAFGATFLLGEKDEAPSAPAPSGGENKVNTTINVDKVADSVIEAVAEKSSPSVVGIRTTAAVSNFFGGVSDSTGEGSGVIYKSDGYIITNYHVVESVIGQTSNSAKIEVFLNNDAAESYPATIIGYNINSDLAVIKIEKTSLPAIDIGNSDKLKIGQFVAAIGCPGGLDFMGSVSYGIVSGLDRKFSANAQSEVSLIQTDAAINPGNSGGALLNIEGELIGINSSKIASTAYEGMGFAIPVNSVVEICDQIIAKKDDPEPFVGVTISETYDEQTLLRLGYPAGAVVSSVVTGGPAAEGGIRRGDIITEFDKKKINSFDDLYAAIDACSVGEVVSVRLYRSGRYYSTEIEITSNNAF